LLLSLAFISFTAATDTSAQSTSEASVEAVIAGHAEPHWRARVGSIVVTADPSGRLFVWEQRGGTTVVVGGRQFGEIDAFAESRGEIYLHLEDAWHRLVLDDELSLSDRMTEAQCSELDISTREARRPISTSHLAPKSARPIELSSNRRVVMTDMGRISLVTHEVLPEADSPLSPDVSMANGGMTAPGQEDRWFDIIEEDDPSCARGVSFSVRGFVDDEPRWLLERSCRRPYPFRFESDDGAPSVGVLLVDAATSAFHGNGSAQLTEQRTMRPTLMRFSAALDHVQSVRLPDARIQDGAIRGACLRSTCYLDIGSTETGWQWEKSERSTAAEKTDYALSRSVERVVLGGAGWLRVQVPDEAGTLIWLTDRGAVSVCGVSEALTGQILYRAGHRIYTSIEEPARCETFLTR
jgi:hypothetical protein